MTVKYPKVSVIIPAYNCENYIGAAIDSILGQNYPSLEILVVDDGSTDSTADVLETFGDKVQVISQKNSGSAVARNIGLEKSTGDYIAFLDSDDIWLEGKLSSQVSFLETHAEYGLVYSDWVCWHPDKDGIFKDHGYDKDTTSAKRPLSGWLFEELIKDCIVWTGTVLMRRAVYEKTGAFDATLMRGQDYDYWLRIAQEFKIHKLADIHAVYRIHDQSVSHKPKSINYQYVLLRKALTALEKGNVKNQTVDQQIITDRLSESCFTFAYQHFHQGDILVALNNIILSLKYNPKNYKSWKYLCLSLIKLPISLLSAGDARP
jgi:glycosyltransferase involved in cell wall biosynthesis